MSAGLGKCSNIRHIVRLRQLLRRWCSKACTSAKLIPSDVPAGHVAVCVGTSCTRFVVRASYLNHPVFKKLLVQAEEEYGFSNSGPLAIPCHESLFEEVLRFISRSESGNATRLANIDDFQRHCHVGVRSNLDLWADSRPLLRGLSEKTIWWELGNMAQQEAKRCSSFQCRGRRIKKVLFVLRQILLQDQTPMALEELPPIKDQASTALWINIINTHYTRSHDQFADIFTKPLPTVQFIRILSKLGSRNPLDPT